jgi:hypothetical protein
MCTQNGGGLAPAITKTEAIRARLLQTLKAMNVSSINSEFDMESYTFAATLMEYVDETQFQLKQHSMLIRTLWSLLSADPHLWL